MLGVMETAHGSGAPDGTILEFFWEELVASLPRAKFHVGELVSFVR